MQYSLHGIINMRLSSVGQENLLIIVPVCSIEQRTLNLRWDMDSYIYKRFKMLIGIKWGTGDR